jgi:anti-sigma-K factor RskA
MDHQTVRELTAAYALDALSREDEDAFESHLAHCAACRAEVEAFQEVAAALAHDVEATAPPPALRDRILEHARSERPNVVPLRRRWIVPTAAAVAAVAACAAIGLGIWAASLHGRLGDEQSAASSSAAVVSVLTAEDAQRVPVSGAEGSLVVAPDGQAVLIVDGLATAPKDKTYQAWVIENGEAKPAGTFTSSGARTAIPLDRPVPKGSTVAVTVEKAGGVGAPTTKPLFSANAV